MYTITVVFEEGEVEYASPYRSTIKGALTGVDLYAYKFFSMNGVDITNMLGDILVMGDIRIVAK